MQNKGFPEADLFRAKFFPKDAVKYAKANCRLQTSDWHSTG